MRMTACVTCCDAIHNGPQKWRQRGKRNFRPSKSPRRDSSRAALQRHQGIHQKEAARRTPTSLAERCCVYKPACTRLGRSAIMYYRHAAACSALTVHSSGGDRHFSEAITTGTTGNPRGDQCLPAKTWLARGPSANSAEQNQRTSRPPAVDIGHPRARKTRFRVTGACAQTLSLP